MLQQCAICPVATVAVPSQHHIQKVVYVPLGKGQAIYIMRFFVRPDGSSDCDIHRGCRTGRPVRFVHMADALRLCEVLNASLV